MRVYSPTPDEQAECRRLLTALDATAGAGLVTVDGRVAVPGVALPLIVEVLRRLADGEAVAIESLPPEREIAFDEAAEILNISHAQCAQLLRTRKLALPLYGNDDRVRLTDVLRYRAARHVLQDFALALLAEESQRLGLY